MSRVYLLERTQRLELPIEQVFEFFSRAENLEKVTPAWVKFRLLTPRPVEVGPGTLLDYRLRVHGVPVRWRARIEVWKPPRRFVDVQLRGPYALWEHTHTFEPLGADTVLIRDRVRYALPLGALGALTRAAFVKRDLERIFDYRQQSVVRWLGPRAQSGQE